MITADGLIGPVSLRDTMNAWRYLEVLEDTLVPSLCDIDRDRDIDRVQDMIFMQDKTSFKGPPYATAIPHFLSD